MDADWKIILAIATAAVLQSVAYAIREWANGLKVKKAEEDRKRMENKIDGNTALCATNLVSSGNLPKAAPCIPAVANAINSQTSKDGVEACEYAAKATAVAHETMEREGLPINSQDSLLDKLRTMIDETSLNQIEDVRLREERHNKNNLDWIEALRKEIDRLKAEIQPGIQAGIQAKVGTGPARISERK